MREAHNRKGKNRNVSQFQKDSDATVQKLNEKHTRSSEEQLIRRKEAKLGSGKERKRIVGNRNTWWSCLGLERKKEGAVLQSEEEIPEKTLKETIM